MELATKDSEHVHSGVGLFLEKNHDVVAVDFKTFGFFDSDSVCLVRSLFEHGCKSEKFAVGRFVDDNFLMVFVDGCDADLSRDHDVSVAIGVPDFVDALAGSEFFQFDLTREDGGFVIVEKSEERNVFE